MDETGELHVKQSKPGSKSQRRKFSLICGSETYKLNVYIDTDMITYISYIFTYIYIVRARTKLY
jgi:hypothetical protein